MGCCHPGVVVVALLDPGLPSLIPSGYEQCAGLRIEIDEEAFERLYGTVSHPIRVNKPGQKIAVRCISQFGEETTKVMEP
jgi:hypothetical protein